MSRPCSPRGATPSASASPGAWATEYFGFRDNAHPHYGAQPQVAAQLLIEYADGRSELVPTDTSWKASTGPLVASGLYEGETFDAARSAPAGRFSGSASTTPRGRRPRPRPRIVAPEPAHVAVRAADRGAAGARGDHHPGGQDGARLRPEPRRPAAHPRAGPGGHDGHPPPRRGARARRARHAPAARRRGHRPLHARGRRASEEWEPEFTFHGFRYAEVVGLAGRVRPGATSTAVVLHSDMERTGWFETSHPLVNQLHENIVWGLRGNFLYLPTDCPQRDERLGWTGDIQVFAPTASFLYDVRRLPRLVAARPRDRAGGRRRRRAVRRAERARATARPAAAWGDAATVVPWVLHERFGDVATLERQYPSMTSWVDTLLEIAGRSPPVGGAVPVRRLARPGCPAGPAGEGEDRRRHRRQRPPLPLHPQRRARRGAAGQGRRRRALRPHRRGGARPRS